MDQAHQKEAVRKQQAVVRCNLPGVTNLGGGQTINESGISPDQDKVKAIIDMPEPPDVSGIRRFLGMINQLGKFTPHLAEITNPMRDLLS